MSKPSFFVWLLLGPAFTGLSIVALLNIPAAQDRIGMWIIVAAVVAHVVTLPLARVIGKAMT